MEILHKGNPARAKAYNENMYRFSCTICGCVWNESGEKCEYTQGTMWFPCPTCGHTTVSAGATYKFLEMVP